MTTLENVRAEAVQVHLVWRTGKVPLRVRGELVASVGTPLERARVGSAGCAGWNVRLAIYRTASGRFVAAIGRHSALHREPDSYDAKVFGSLREAVDWLLEVAPSPEVDWLLEKLPSSEIAEEVD